ncbi:MAG: M28 family peptidase [Pirellulales bacterium]
MLSYRACRTCSRSILTQRSTSRAWSAVRFLATTLLAGLVTPSAPAVASESASLSAAMASITSDDLQRHVDVLADDIFEGREAGSRGGRAAATYLRKALRQAGMVGVAARGAFFQEFSGGYRNLLCILPGSDARLKDEYVLVSAHYDHVGYGSRRNSYGPIGLIHNGADDNASGCAAILELVEAFGQLDPSPRRSIVFALWDGEEKGLLGSRHWVAHPTVPIGRVRIALNMDMIGRLRNERLEVGGTRTTRGTRRIFSSANEAANLQLNFTWKLVANSDHWSFRERNIPSVFVHTGLHGDYHRPSDDAHLINAEGSRRVVRVVFQTVYQWAESESLANYRVAGSRETETTRRWRERPLRSLPARLGVRWLRQPAAAEDEGGVVLRAVRPGSPADRAGLHVGDRMEQFAGRPIRNGDDLRMAVATAPREAEVVIVRPEEGPDGPPTPHIVTVALAGQPVRVGISWRADDGEPGLALLTRVVPGSPAQTAGLRVGDRIYAVDNAELEKRGDLARRLKGASGSVSLLVENRGRLRSVTLDLPPTAKTGQP